MILGIDEAGRGPWAGPLVVGAVVLNGQAIEGLNDSKKLTKKRRELLEQLILDKATTGLGWVSSQEIDEVGLSEALKLATRRAVKQIQSKNVSFHEIIIDGSVNFLSGTALENYVKTMPRADSLIPTVSAASIIAKVARDRYMASLDENYSGYSFSSHVGYGTILHRAAIEKLGVTPEHRLSFAPLAKYRTAQTPSIETGYKQVGKVQTTRAVADESESAAAAELVRLGHKIIDRNWKNRYCEIDIVSLKDQTVYFTEVKHRKNDLSGDGIAAITPRKLKQMRYAAQFYVHIHELVDYDQALIAMSTSGEEPTVDKLINIE